MYKAVSLPRRRHYTAVSVSVDYYYFSALWLWLDMSVAAAAAATAAAVVVAAKIVSLGTLTICRLEVFDGYVRIYTYIYIYQSLVSLKCAIAKVCLCTRAKRHNEFKSQEAQQQQ